MCSELLGRLLGMLQLQLPIRIHQTILVVLCRRPANRLRGMSKGRDKYDLLERSHILLFDLVGRQRVPVRAQFVDRIDGNLLSTLNGAVGL